jgi:hypothetical protein
MNDRFFEAWITRRWRVCGRLLQPLCLGHIVNLAAVESPLSPFADIEPETVITPGDLLLAIRICSEKFPHPCRIKPGILDRITLLLLELFPALFLFHARLFAAYRADHTSSPEFWVSQDSEGRSISAPIALSKAAFLHSNTSLSESRIWSMPLGRADYLIAAIEERMTGGVRFLDERELQSVTPPLEETLSEEEILEIARRDLGPGSFEAWLEARQKWQAKETA